MVSFMNVVLTILLTFVTGKSLHLGPMVKADNSSPRWPGFDSCENLKLFSVYSMDVMDNEPLTCLTLNRLEKSDGQL